VWTYQSLLGYHNAGSSKSQARYILFKNSTTGK